MSNITGLTFTNQPESFPGSPFTVTRDLKGPILQEWISIENGTPINGKTVTQLVAGAIQQKVKQSQNADAVLNSLTFGPQNQIGFTGTFVAPPANAAQTPGVGGKVNVTLTVPGNNLAFTVMKSSNPTFEVNFSLVVRLVLTFPVSTAAAISSDPSNWAVGLSVTAEVEVSEVTTHNVGVFLCDKSAVTDVLKAINDQVISLPDVATSAFSLLNSLVQTFAASGATELLESDDGHGNIVLLAVGNKLTVSGGTNDKIEIGEAGGKVTVSAQGQSGSFAGPIHSITVNTGAGTNSVKITGLPAGSTATVQNAQKGKNTVTIGGSGLAAMPGTTINVNDASGTTALIVDDSDDDTARTATVTKSAVVFIGLTTVNYSGNITSLKVIGGAGNDQFLISSLSAGTSATLDAGMGGTNSVYAGVFGTNPGLAGKGDGSVGQINGPLSVTDASGATSLVIDSSGDAYEWFQVTSSGVLFTNGPTISYQPGGIHFGLMGQQPVETKSGVTSLTIYGSEKGDNITVPSVAQYTPVTIWGTAADKISGAAAASITHDLYLVLKTGPVPHVPLAAAGGKP